MSKLDPASAHDFAQSFRDGLARARTLNLVRLQADELRVLAVNPQTSMVEVIPKVRTWIVVALESAADLIEEQARRIAELEANGTKG